MTAETCQPEDSFVIVRVSEMASGKMRYRHVVDTATLDGKPPDSAAVFEASGLFGVREAGEGDISVFLSVYDSDLNNVARYDLPPAPAPDYHRCGCGRRKTSPADLGCSDRCRDRLLDGFANLLAWESEEQGKVAL